MDTPEQTDIPTERGEPQVAILKKNQKIVGGSLVAAAIVGLIALVINASSSKENDQPIVTHQDIVFKSPPKSAAPYIKPEAPSSSTVAAPAAASPDPQKNFLQAEAMRMASENQKMLQKRLLSPQVIYDQANGSAAGSNGTSHTTGDTASPTALDPNDANQAFVAQAGNQGYETVRASQMKNLGTLITQSTMISGILETAIQSDLAGMTRAVVSEDVYSFDGTKLIIPKGSKLVGQYRSGVVRGQSRVFVVWNRLLRSDGVTVNLGSYGTDSLGRSGLDGEVDTHFFERFGSSVLLSMIDTSLQIAASNAKDATTATVALETGNDFSRAAEIALENSIGIPPTINVEQGKRIKVFVSKDLDFAQVVAEEEGISSEIHN